MRYFQRKHIKKHIFPLVIRIFLLYLQRILQKLRQTPIIGNNPFRGLIVVASHINGWLTGTIKPKHAFRYAIGAKHYFYRVPKGTQNNYLS